VDYNYTLTYTRNRDENSVKCSNFEDAEVIGQYLGEMLNATDISLTDGQYTWWYKEGVWHSTL